MLANMKIGLKILACVVALTMTSLVISFYCVRIMNTADDEYSLLIEDKMKSTLFMARAARNVNDIGYSVYRAIKNDGAGEAAQSAAKNASEKAKEAIALLADVSTRIPDHESDLAPIRSGLMTLTAAMDAALPLALSNRDEDALAAMATFDAAAPPLVKSLRSLNETLLVETDARSAELTDISNRTGVLVLAGTILAGLVGIALSLLVSAKGITGPLNRLRERMEQMASGRLEGEVEGQTRGDEVGRMAKALQVFKENALRAKVLETEAADARALADSERGRTETMRRQTEEEQKLVVTSLAEGLDKVANGDLTARLDQSFPPDYRQLQSDFNAAVTKLKETLSAVVGSAHGMTAQTGEISAASDDLARRTEQQAAAIEETAASLNDITQAVRRTADSARKAADVTGLARQGAETSSAVVRQAVEAMGEIEKSSDQIGKIIGVIDEIAFQTNLLALNAGVEAARAGEAGRGFAVVAQEVRGLAQRSAEAAKEIKQLIATSSSQVGQGVALVAQTGTALDKMAEQVGELTALVTGIADSAKEQAVGLNEVNTAVNQMDQVTQQNAAMVEQATAASKSLADEAQELQRLMSQFQTGAATPSAKRPAQPRRSARPSSARPTQGGAATARKTDAEPEAGWEEF